MRAILSVYDKTGIVDFARGLEALGFELFSTGGTEGLLRDAGINVRGVQEITGFPEMLGGRVKTLHPAVHGGILALRDDPGHLEELARHDLKPIDLVASNLYPFLSVARDSGARLPLALENIDIGGHTLLRAAAKNFPSVLPVCHPRDYERVLEELGRADGVGLDMRRRLAAKAFQHCALYDTIVAEYLRSERERFPESLTLALRKISPLRYGENPHQDAALYGDFDKRFEKLQGKELSFNNLLDISAATNLIAEFEEPTVAILKHTNPCGVGSDTDLCKAWEKAFATDKQAPFGGIIVCNRSLNEAVAKVISEIFSEVIIAPDFEIEARAVLQKKKNLRLIRLLALPKETRPTTDLRSVCGGVLVQDADVDGELTPNVVTKRRPTKAELNAMLFGWRVVKHVKSNAIVYAKADRTLGIGAGQMSRVDASRIAVWKANEAGLSLKGSAVASDAFFPFPDGLIAAAEAGATCAIQPGGSVRDEEVIAAANERKMAMIFTGVRHFRH